MCGRFTIRKPVTKTVDIVKTNIKVEDSDNYNVSIIEKTSNPSKIPPIAGPCDSPKVVSLKSEPKMLPAILPNMQQR